MGTGVAGNLAAAGVLCTLYDVNETAFNDLDMPPLSGQKIIDEVNAILFAVPSTEQIVRFLQKCIGHDTTIINLTTSVLAQSHPLVTKLKNRGFNYINEAMNGRARGADASALTPMAGGDIGQIVRSKSLFGVIYGRLQRAEIGCIWIGLRLTLR
ncbi:MAG: NAD(P)-binding domain-containing protein [Roseobacter sp.]